MGINGILSLLPRYDGKPNGVFGHPGYPQVILLSHHANIDTEEAVQGGIRWVSARDQEQVSGLPQPQLQADTMGAEVSSYLEAPFHLSESIAGVQSFQGILLVPDRDRRPPCGQSSILP